MHQSRILGSLEMTHSTYISDQKIKVNQIEQDELLKTLVNNARKSYIGQKSSATADKIKTQDMKPRAKSRIFHDKKSQSYIPDLTVSRLPNYNILSVENISKTNFQNCFFSFMNRSEPCEIVIQEPYRLIMYKKGTQQTLYTLNFDTICAEVRESFSKSDSKQFLLIADKLILQISHENLSILKSWHRQIASLIQNSCGRQLEMNDLPITYPANFYKRYFCTEDEFTNNCETGDILLFQDEHFFAKAQRFLLNSDYDHVAMIIKDKKYGILMFQANSLSGVSLTPWNCMVKYGWYKFIRRIVWRKLQGVQRTEFFQTIIHKFVKQNLKQNYYISFDKLLSNKSYIAKKQQQKGFFCSQLIATIYKDLQIMTRDRQSKHYIAASSVYPYHFSEKFDLKLQMGTLSKEHEIHFHQKMLQKQYGKSFLQR